MTQPLPNVDYAAVSSSIRSALELDNSPLEQGHTSEKRAEYVAAVRNSLNRIGRYVKAIGFELKGCCVKFVEILNSKDKQSNV